MDIVLEFSACLLQKSGDVILLLVTAKPRKCLAVIFFTKYFRRKFSYTLQEIFVIFTGMP
jgi:hypothetical protein